MRKNIYESLSVPFRLALIMWSVFFIEIGFGINLAFLGIWPRETFGLVGIITGPAIHGNSLHLLSNTIPLMFLGATLFLFYERIAGKVFFLCYIITGMLVWLLARPTFHIGASGVIYGLASFLICFGFFRKDFRSLFISIVMVFFYGGLIYGVLPNQAGISWESHLFGGMVGAASAFYYGKLRKVRI